MFFSEDEFDIEQVADELKRRASTGLAAGLHDIGLYVDDVVIVKGPEHGPVAAISINATVGRVAFRDRVQDPDQVAVDAMFEDLTEHMVDDEFERRRRALGE